MLPESSCSGKRAGLREICDRRDECKYYIANYHIDKQKKIMYSGLVISPSSCIVDDYKNFEEIDDV